MNNEGLRITGQNNNAVIFTSPSINSSAGYRLNHHPATNVLRVDTTNQNGTYTGTVASFSSAGLDMADNIKLRLGTSQDLTLYHYGNNAYIDNATGDILFRQGTSEKLRIASAGQVLIGTTSSLSFNGAGGNHNLVVAGDSNDTDITDNHNAAITISNKDGTANNTAGLHFAREDTDGNPHYDGASVVAQFKETMNTGQYPKADLVFLTSSANNNAPSEKVRLTAAGEFLVGATSSSGARGIIQQNSSDTNPLDQQTCADSSGLRLHNYSFGTGRYTALSLEACNSSSVQSASIIAQSVASGTAPDIIIAQRTSNTANTERLRIASDGEVFIGSNFGATNRSTLLSISGPNQNPTGVWTQVGVYANDSVGQDRGGSIGFGGHDGSVAQQQFSAIKGAKENGNSGNYAGYLAFYTRPSGAVSQERMRIKSNGVVDINGMFCAGKPGNFGSVSSTQGCRITGQQGSHPAALSFDGGGTPTLELGSTSGQTIIGSNSYNSSPMNFKSGMAIGTLGGGTTRFQINSNGNIGAPTGNNIYNASDERLKENMVELTDGLSKIQKLKPISFTWKEGWDVNLDGKKEYGFGAQTTEAVDELLVGPFSLVDAELNGEIIENPLRVNEKYIIPLLVKAVQEQQEQIETLKEKIASLEGS